MRSLELMGLGRFYIETMSLENAILFQARGPFGMRGGWHDSEQGTYLDLLKMFDAVKLTAEETELYSHVTSRVEELRIREKETAQRRMILKETELCAKGNRFLRKRTPGGYIMKCPTCWNHAVVGKKQNGDTYGRCEHCGVHFGTW